MVPGKATKRVFVTSTILDLEQERAFVKRFLEGYEAVSITCLLSEAPDFPVTPPQLSEDVYEACIHNLLGCDYVVQLLNERYGVPDIADAGQLISITHKEYREAFRRRLPVFTLIDKRLWAAYKAHKRGGGQTHVREAADKLFHFLEEIQFLDEIPGRPRKRWLFRYASLREIESILRTSFLTFDDSVFVADVTIPDGSTVQTNETFEKIWEIRNNGMVVWQDRSLREQNPGCGLLPDTPTVPVPETRPGATARIQVLFRAPKYPASVESYWKMVDASGRYCFPWKKGIWCRVRVVD